MNGTTKQISIRGRQVPVTGADIGGVEIVVTGSFLKTASLRDEEWQDGLGFSDAQVMADQIRRTGLAADLLAFSDFTRGIATQAQGTIREKDNAAVAAITNYDKWWTSLPQEARKNARRAAKRGVVIRSVAFDDRLVNQIKAIYDESPVRQGRKFWHYGKCLEVVARENGTYVDRSEFLGAFLGDRMIGFVKLVFVGSDARIMQIVCLNSERDRRPVIALLVRAAEVAHGRGCRYLIYGKFSYGRRVNTSLAEFKRRLGFEQLDFDRHFVPLTLLGRISITTGLHQGLAARMPVWLVEQLAAARARILRQFDPTAASAGPSN